MRLRPLVPLVLIALAIVAVALPAGAGAALVKIPKLPKAAKVTQYPVTVDTVGYLEYTWTWDATSSCSPGYAKTVEEDLGFELGRPRAAKLSIVNGKVMLFPVTGGDGTVQTELSGWRTTNYCPPAEPAPEPPEPTCKRKLRSQIGIAIEPVKEGLGEDDPTPLVRQTQVSIHRTKVVPQTVSCHEHRPKIEAEFETDKGWYADPQVGLAAPLNATDVSFLRLGVGETLRRTIRISGGCGKASFDAQASATISPFIRSCVVKGKAVVIVKRTGRGFG